MKYHSEKRSWVKAVHESNTIQKKHSHELKTVHESNIIQRKHMIEKSIHECKYQGMNGFVYELKNVHELNKIVHEWFLKSIHELK
jgi:hypothetical protein